MEKHCETELKYNLPLVEVVEESRDKREGGVIKRVVMGKNFCTKNTKADLDLNGF